MAYRQPSLVTKHFGSPLAMFPWTDTKVYIAISALCVNVVVAVVATVVLRMLRAPDGTDATAEADYYSDTPSPEVIRAAERVEAGG
jgi:SSS family solute:Na+ symporter